MYSSLAAGADPAATADARITPLESAALHGSSRAADILALHGLRRRSLWLAATAGQLPRVHEWVSPDGRLLKDPGRSDPTWPTLVTPPGSAATDDRAEIIGEGLVFAAASNRMDVIWTTSSPAAPISMLARI